MRYIKNPDVVLREVDEDGALLFNPDTNQVLILNPTALLVWQECKSPKNLDQLLNAVRENFADVPPEAEEHVKTFVEQMAAGGFLGTAEAN